MNVVVTIYIHLSISIEFHQFHKIRWKPQQEIITKSIVNKIKKINSPHHLIITTHTIDHTSSSPHTNTTPQSHHTFTTSSINDTGSMTFFTSSHLAFRHVDKTHTRHISTLSRLSRHAPEWAIPRASLRKLKWDPYTQNGSNFRRMSLSATLTTYIEKERLVMVSLKGI